MKKIILISSILLAGLLSFQSATADIFNFGGIRTNIYSFSNKSFENAETETRSMMPISGISNDGPLNVVYVEGDKNEVVIKGDKNLFCRVQTEYKNGIVHISLEPGTYRNVWLQVVVYAKSLNSIRCTGSGNLTAEKVTSNAEEMLVKITGSAVVSIDALNCSRDLDFHISGSGDIKVQNVQCKDLDLDITGSGNVTCNKTKLTDLEGDVRGSGGVKFEYIEGDEAELNIAGSGDFRFNGGSINYIKARIAGSGDISGRLKYKSIEQKTAGSGTVHLIQD